MVAERYIHINTENLVVENVNNLDFTVDIIQDTEEKKWYLFLNTFYYKLNACDRDKNIIKVDSLRDVRICYFMISDDDDEHGVYLECLVGENHRTDIRIAFLAMDNINVRTFTILGRYISYTDNADISYLDCTQYVGGSLLFKVYNHETRQVDVKTVISSKDLDVVKGLVFGVGSRYRRATQKVTEKWKP